MCNWYFFLCVAASRNISMFFDERAAASEKILTTASKRKKMCDYILELCPLKELFWSEKQIKIKTRWKHILHFRSPLLLCIFLLNYCDENHIEIIPIPVKIISHLFHLASEIIKGDNLHLFLLSDGTRIDDNEYLNGLENGTELIACTEEQI